MSNTKLSQRKLSKLDRDAIVEEYRSQPEVWDALTVHDKARLVRRHYQLEQQRWREADLLGEPSRAGERTGIALGMSAQHVFLFLKILKAPDEVLEALNQKKLSMKTVGIIALLHPSDQQKIVKEIARGVPPKLAVREYLEEREEYRRANEPSNDRLKKIAVESGEVLCKTTLEFEQAKNMQQLFIARGYDPQEMLSETLDFIDVKILREISDNVAGLMKLTEKYQRACGKTAKNKKKAKRPRKP